MKTAMRKIFNAFVKYACENICYGFTFYLLWALFIKPTFNAPQLPCKSAIGIVIALGVFWTYKDEFKQSLEKKWRSLENCGSSDHSSEQKQDFKIDITCIFACALALMIYVIM